MEDELEPENAGTKGRPKGSKNKPKRGRPKKLPEKRPVGRPAKEIEGATKPTSFNASKSEEALLDSVLD